MRIWKTIIKNGQIIDVAIMLPLPVAAEGGGITLGVPCPYTFLGYRLFLMMSTKHRRWMVSFSGTILEDLISVHTSCHLVNNNADH